MMSLNQAIINKLVIKCNGTLDTHKPSKLVCLNIRVMERLRKACMSHSGRRIYRGRAFRSQSQTALLSQGLFPDPSQESSIFVKPTPPCYILGTHTAQKTPPPQLGHPYFITCGLSLKVCPARTFTGLLSFFFSSSFISDSNLHKHRFKTEQRRCFSFGINELLQSLSFLKSPLIS